MSIDPTTIFAVAAGVILIGFVADIFFKRTGVPSVLFLILLGVAIGPILGLISQSLILPVLSTIAELTLIMVLFYGGMEIKIKTLLRIGNRIIVQVIIYVFTSAILIAIFANYVLGWGWIQSLIFGAILGGELTPPVIVPVSRGLKLPEQTIAFLTLESALTVIFTVILFVTFIGLYQTGTLSLLSAASLLISSFSIGVVIGLVLALLWLFTLNYVKKYKYTYVLTVGLVLLTYVITTLVGGSGLLSVLVFGLILGNNSFVGELIKRGINIGWLQKRLADFQDEVSFLLETVFFVFLGLIFSIAFNSVVLGILAGGIITLILISTRALASGISTFRSTLSKDRKIITLICALGVTPATLAILSISYGIPHASSYVLLVTYVIIFTNIITTLGAYFFARSRGTEIGMPKPLAKVRVSKGQ